MVAFLVLSLPHGYLVERRVPLLPLDALLEGVDREAGLPQRRALLVRVSAELVQRRVQAVFHGQVQVVEGIGSAGLDVVLRGSARRSVGERRRVRHFGPTAGEHVTGLVRDVPERANFSGVQIDPQPDRNDLFDGSLNLLFVHVDVLGVEDDHDGLARHAVVGFDEPDVRGEVTGDVTLGAHHRHVHELVPVDQIEEPLSVSLEIGVELLFVLADLLQQVAGSRAQPNGHGLPQESLRRHAVEFGSFVELVEEVDLGAGLESRLPAVFVPDQLAVLPTRGHVEQDQTALLGVNHAQALAVDQLFDVAGFGLHVEVGAAVFKFVDLNKHHFKLVNSNF